MNTRRHGALTKQKHERYLNYRATVGSCKKIKQNRNRRDRRQARKEGNDVCTMA